MQSIHETTIIMIGLGVVAVVGYVIFEYMRRQQKPA
jgi:hypothetical protein